ncbi:unnamed protein product [Urochloa humidicola]
MDRSHSNLRVQRFDPHLRAAAAPTETPAFFLGRSPLRPSSFASASPTSPTGYVERFCRDDDGCASP